MMNMATTLLTRKCIDCGGPLEARKDSEQWQVQHQHDACNDCFDYWGHENGHSDGGHDYILQWLRGELYDEELEPGAREWMTQEIPLMAGCRVCMGRNGGPAEGPEKDPEPADSKTWHSHKGHGHALTQAARARCRRRQQREQGL